MHGKRSDGGRRCIPIRAPLQVWTWLAAVAVAVALTPPTQMCAVPFAPAIALMILCATAFAGVDHRDRWIRRVSTVTAVAAASALPIVRALLFGGTQHAHDLAAHTWAIEGTARGLLSGEFPVRWLDNVGMGMPTLQFYPPATYHLGGTLRAAGLPPDTTVTALIGIAGIFGAWTTYVCLRDMRFARSLATLGAVLFVVAPFRLYDANYRFALAELYGLALLLPFWHGALRVALGTRGPRIRRPVAWLVTAAAGLVLIHTLSVITGVLTLTILLPAAWLRTERSSWTPRATLPRVSYAVALTVGLTAWFVVPVVIDGPHASLRSVMPSSASAYQAKSIHASEPWIRQPWNGIHTNTPLQRETELRAAGRSFEEPPFYLGWLLFFPVVWMAAVRRVSDAPDVWPYALGAVAAWSMTTPSVSYVFGHASLFRPLQFPWRFLGPATVAAIPAAVGFVRQYVPRHSMRAWLVAIAVAAIVDAWPGFGGGGWVQWPDSATADARFVRTRGAPTCQGTPSRQGWSPTPVSRPPIVDGAAFGMQLWPTPDPPRPPTESWEGAATGDVPRRWSGLKFPPGGHAGIGLLHRSVPEYQTPIFRKIWRHGWHFDNPRAFAAAGAELQVQSLLHERDIPLTPWSYVRLLTDEGWASIRGHVVRPGPSSMTVELPPHHPGGTLELGEMAFPGWVVSVDGGAWRRADASRGLLATHVVADTREVAFRYGAFTPARRAANAISLISLLLAGAGWIRGRRRQ